MGGERRLVRTRAVILLAAVFLLTANVSQAKYSDGTGEPDNPYRIATPNDLNDIGNHVEDFNKCFVLINDINLADYSYTTALIGPDINESSGGFDGTAFTGIFDGNDCSISNLTIDTAGADNDFLGLFGRIEDPGQVKNLGIEEVSITGGDNSYLVGGLCGDSFGSLRSCYVTGSVFGHHYVGGLCGFSMGTISKCYSISSVTGHDNLGGLCGVNGGTISNCYATSSATGGDDSVCVGGLCGFSIGTISECYATGSVTGCNALGGLCGQTSHGTVSYCYSSGHVTGGNDSLQLGGLCGGIFSTTVSNCYATGSVSGGDYSEMVGGLCGYNFRSTISNCYEAGSASGGSNVGGLVGYDDSGSYTYSFWNIETNPYVNGIGNTTDPNVIGKTTAQMQRESTFSDAGWDFVEIWDIGENQTYPFLRIYPAGDLNHDNIVNFFDLAILVEHWLEGTQ